MKRIFLTGATGRVGRRIICDLSREYTIVALVRSPAPEEMRLLSNVEWVVGDVNDVASYGDALSTCDGIIHLAASHSRDVRHVNKVNVEGTRELVQAAHAHRITKIIVFSSVMATQTYRNPYGESKRAMEEMLRTLGVPLIILRASPIYHAKGPVLNGFEKYCRLPLPFIPLMNGGKGDIRPIAIADVTRAIMAILHQPFPGEVMVYDLACERPFTLRQIIQLICAEKKISKPILSIPHQPLAVMYGIGRRLFPKQSARFIQFAGIGEGFHINPKPLIEKYHLSPTDPEEGIRECLK